jgi:hypothetical protein
MPPLICEQMPAHCTHMLIVKSFGENVSVSVTACQHPNKIFQAERLEISDQCNDM